MGFSLKFKNLNDPEFMQGLEELGNLDLNPKLAYNLSKIIDKANQQHKEAGEGFKKIVDKYCEKEEGGSWKVQKRMVPTQDKDGNSVQMETPIPGSYIIPDDKREEFQKEIDTFLDIDFEVERYKIKPSELGDLKVKAKTLAALDPIMEDDATLQVVQ